MKRVLYLGWVGFGNMGDDVCRDLFIQRISELARERTGPLDIRCLYPGHFSAADFVRYSPDLVVLGAGSTIGTPYLEPLVIAAEHGVPCIVWGSGLDGLDEQTMDALRSGTLSLQHLIPFAGYNGSIIRQALHGCAAVGVRGPHTQSILEAIGVSTPHLQICGDPGLLLEVPADSAGELAVPEPLRKWWSDGAPVVGVNWGTALQKLYGRDEKATAARLAAALGRLASDVRILIYSVWKHDLEANAELASLIPANQENVMVVDGVLDQVELALVLSRCTLTINLKLHANIFSAAVGCPFISLAYRSKCYDFAASVESEDRVIRTDDPAMDHRIVPLVEGILANREHDVARLARARTRYVESLNALLGTGLDLLEGR